MKTDKMAAPVLISVFLALSFFVDPVSGQCTGNVQADMVFILDASGSVGASNFQTMLSFVQDLVSDFEIGSNKVRVGVQKYSDGTNSEFNLNTYYDKNAIINAVAGIQYTQGTTNTGGALQFLRTNMFTSGNGDRSSVTNIGVLMSDGVSNDASYTATQAAHARNAGITLFSIGIGSGIPLSELNEIATDPDSDHVFSVSSFSALSGIKSSFQAQACPSVNGNWGGWGSYSTCTKTCGTGSQTRTRNCDSPAPSNGGADCAGSGTQTINCNTQGCPVNGGWGNWGSWGSCSVTCGWGTQSRTRNCDSPSPQNNGAYCSGSDTSTQNCFPVNCPVDGQWATWSSWGTCSTTCELGSWTRSRTCTDPAPAHLGANCPGTNSQTTSCDLGPCPIDGAWGSWQAWGACSVTCMAVGTRDRQRQCDSPSAQHGGAPCPGSGTDIQACDYTLTLCDPGNGWAPQVYATTAGAPVHGGFSSWGSWSACTKTCGAGVRIRTRQCNNPVPRYGGDVCSGSYYETVTCSNVACSAALNYVQLHCTGREYFTCESDGQCIDILKKCDCVPDCVDGSDETMDYAGCTTALQECTNGVAIVRANIVQTTAVWLFFTSCLLSRLLP